MEVDLSCVCLWHLKLTCSLLLIGDRVYMCLCVATDSSGIERCRCDVHAERNAARNPRNRWEAVQRPTHLCICILKPMSPAAMEYFESLQTKGATIVHGMSAYVVHVDCYATRVSVVLCLCGEIEMCARRVWRVLSL